MRHRKAGIKLNRTSSHRDAMFRNMVTSLFKYDRIRTTDAKAKELRRLADNMITLAKRGDLHARRQALAVIREKAVVHKLFQDANERFGHRAGGYTRVVKLGRRPGDAAPVSIVELVVVDQEKKKKKKKKEPAARQVQQAEQTAAVDAPDTGPAEGAQTAADQPPEEEAAATEQPVDVAPPESHGDADAPSLNAESGAESAEKTLAADPESAQTAQGDDPNKTE